MPPTKRAHKSLLQTWIDKEDPSRKYFRIDNGNLFCNPCTKLYNFKQLSQLQQHIKSASHMKNAVKQDNKPERQLLLSESQNKNNPFFEDLCAAFVAADIPWTKLSNPFVRNFLEKYTEKSIPDESTLRKYYLKNVYCKSIDRIRDAIGNSPILLSVDETTDSKGRYIANVLAGAMKKDKFTEPFLLMCKQLEKTNNSTIFQLVLDSFGLLWPNAAQNVINDRFLLFLTDGVAYMKIAGENLKALYPNLLHVTCLAHGINRVAEEIRSHYPEVDKLIGSVKAVFRKAPSRVLKYKEKYPDLELPPAPIYTRWGTWLTAVDFYAENWQKVKSVVDELNSSDAKCKLQTAKDCLGRPTLQNELAYISANFTFLAITLEKLQERKIALSESILIVTSAKNELKHVKGDIGKKIYEKIIKVTDKNKDFTNLQKISHILDGESNSEQLPIHIDPGKVACFKYAPITSVEAERSFSMHTSLLTQRRRQMGWAPKWQIP